MLTLIIIPLCLHRPTSKHILSVHCVLPRVSFVCMYACTFHVHCTRIQCVHTAMHTYLLVAQCRMQPRLDTVYFVVHAYLVRLSYGCCVQVNFDTSLSLYMLLFH